MFQLLDGFLKQKADTSQPKLETLEDRAVPAIISRIAFTDANHNGIPDISEQTRIVRSTPVQSTPAPVASTARVAGASSITREVTFGETATNAARVGSVPLFNPSMGRLLSVQLVAQGQFTSTVHVENMDPAPAQLTSELQGILRYQIGNKTLQSTPSRILEANLGAFDGQPDLQGSSAHSFGVNRLNATFAPQTVSDPATLAKFTGRGSLEVKQEAAVGSDTDGSGNLLAMINSTVQGKVKVVYQYQPRAPLPSVVDPNTVVPWASKFYLISRLRK